jgi:hypothetical protein
VYAGPGLPRHLEAQQQSLAEHMAKYPDNYKPGARH